MELDREKVLARFLLYCGEDQEEAGQDRRNLWESLCGDCARWVEERAGPGAPAWEAALEGLAAARAFYQLVLLEGAASPESISTPELKLAWQGREERARQLAEEAERLCRPALQQGDFYFGRA